MERVNFDDVTVAELKEMLRQRGKHGGGKKADLIKRLQSEIVIIRSNRDANSRAGAIPPPLASPTHQLNKTLGGMYLDTPPVHAGIVTTPLSPSGPSNLLYTLYNTTPIVQTSLTGLTANASTGGAVDAKPGMSVLP